MKKTWKYDKPKKITFIISIIITMISIIGIISILIISVNKQDNLLENNDIKIALNTKLDENSDNIILKFVLLNLDTEKYRKYTVDTYNSDVVVDGNKTTIKQSDLLNLDENTKNIIINLLDTNYEYIDDNYYYTLTYMDKDYYIYNSIEEFDKLFE